MKSKMVNMTIPLFIILLMWACCNYASLISSSIRESITVCLGGIIPSIYAFMIVSDLLVKTNSHKMIGRVLSPISRYALHLDGKLFAIFLISLLAGYPIGAKLISSLESENSIDTHIAKKMYCYCYSGGLAFIVGTVGSNSSNGLKISLIIYISNILSNLTLAILLNMKSKVPKKDTSAIDIKISSNTLIDSINSSFKVILNICIMIVAFSIVISLMDSFKISNLISSGVSKIFNISASSSQSILHALLEVSRVSEVNVVGQFYLPTLAMIFSFGGICVIMQIVTLSGKSFNLFYFIKCRLFTSGVSFILCYILTKLFLTNDITVGYMCSAQVSKESSIIPSICLLCMSFIVLAKSTRHFSNKVI